MVIVFYGLGLIDHLALIEPPQLVHFDVLSVYHQALLVSGDQFNCGTFPVFRNRFLNALEIVLVANQHWAQFLNDHSLSIGVLKHQTQPLNRGGSQWSNLSLGLGSLFRLLFFPHLSLGPIIPLLFLFGFLLSVVKGFDGLKLLLELSLLFLDFFLEQLFHRGDLLVLSRTSRLIDGVFLHPIFQRAFLIELFNGIFFE